MRINQSLSRSESVRKKRTAMDSSSHPVKTKKSSHQTYQTSSNSRNKNGGQSTLSRHGVYRPNLRNNGTAPNSSKAKIKAPEISIPTFGPRMISAILVGIMGFFWISLWNSPAFSISEARLVGNVRLVDSDINAFLSVMGDPVFSVIPDEIEKDLKIIFPEIETVEVKITLPNNINVKITERNPVIVWVHPDGSQNWIDIQGVAFPIRGQVNDLISVTSYGEPPKQLSTDASIESELPSVIPYIQPSLIENIIELSKLAPQGSSISYNPSYGLGWKDPLGWNVYFGENTEDVSMKMNIYQAIISRLTQQGIQPSMISVEYLDAPFYRTD